MDKNNFDEDELYSDDNSNDDFYAEKISLNKEPPSKTLTRRDDTDDLDAEKISSDKEPPSKTLTQFDDTDDLDAEKISSDKEPPSKTLTRLDEIDDSDAEKISSDKESRSRTFHSKNFIDSETQAAEDRKKSSAHEPELKMKLSHAEASGVVISAVMLVYSFSEADKPLLFLSTALLIFLLRPLIGALFGKHNRAVQNALHSFSLVLFIGALLFLFL